MRTRIQILTAMLGLTSVLVFVVSFVLFANLNPDFNILTDYISKLGSTGQPYAAYWNALGFGLVGIAFCIHGWYFGVCLNDHFMGSCFVVSGLGFAMAATPADFSDAQSSLSKVHFASICFALAGWCLGLARLVRASSPDKGSQNIASFAVVLALLPILGIGAGISTEPISHRLVLAVVFGWVVLNSIRLLRTNAVAETVG